jgi:hypothetical protein
VSSGLHPAAPNSSVWAGRRRWQSDHPAGTRSPPANDWASILSLRPVFNLTGPSAGRDRVSGRINRLSARSPPISSLQLSFSHPHISPRSDQRTTSHLFACCDISRSNERWSICTKDFRI